MRAFEYGTRAAKAFAREQRRDNPAMRRPSRVESLRPTAIRQIFDDPRALTPTQSKCVRPSGYVKPVELARRRCGAKGRAKRRGMEAPRVKLAGGDEADFAHDFRPGDGRFQKRVTADAERFANRQRRHAGTTAGVDDRFFQGIVIIEPMSQRSIGKHGVGGCNSD